MCLCKHVTFNFMPFVMSVVSETTLIWVNLTIGCFVLWDYLSESGKLNTHYYTTFCVSMN